ncbi:MAG: response regulator transcription factor [Methylococcales bacterium]|nr:response regulator transcription factor [Methylococcales bacterium]
MDDIYTLSDVDAVIVDALKIDNDDKLLSAFSRKETRFLIVGDNWHEDNQINALTKGAAGYCEISETPKLMLQALEQIIKGDIWIQRLLVPKVIGSLMEMNNKQKEQPVDKKSSESTELLKQLSGREMDVAKMIQKGESNKIIATALHISERTVKAHLSSIFRKLNVSNRLHLALFIKEFG